MADPFSVNAAKSWQIGVHRAFVNALRDIERELPPLFRQIAKDLDLNKIPRGTLEQTNVQIAKHAQAVMVGKWRSRLPRKSPSYRPEDRLTGALGNALANAAMVEDTTDRTISFVNVGLLNQQARHWYRVNYGAAGPNLMKAGGHGAGSFPVPFPGGGTLGTLTDVSRPAARSYLPRAYSWWGQEFVVIAGPGTYPGRGSRPARFTDLGLEATAEAIGPAYAQMYDRYLVDKAGKIRKRGRGR